MSTTLYRGTYFSILATENGTEFVHTADEVLVVPLTAKGQVILTVEPSPAFGEQALILPGGEIDADETPADAADRELQEEIGYRAGLLQFLGELRPYSKYLTVRSLIYLARDLTPSVGQGDEGYPILTERVSLADFERLIAAGRLLDARAIAALYMAMRFSDRNPSMSQTPALARRLKRPVPRR